MTIEQIRALTFDTGGTILNWHAGQSAAFRQVAAKYDDVRDWAALTNEMRRIALGAMVNLGEHEPPAYNFDGAHRSALDEILTANNLDHFTEQDRHQIAFEAAHSLDCWPDFPPVLPLLRERYLCASFTLLSFRIIMDTARHNGLSWDAVFSCEAIGKHKILPEAYITVAKYLQLDPSEICMVACHNFDLDAAKACGFKTAFVRRPDEWGPQGPPDPEPSAHHDIVVDDFPGLARALDVQI